MRIRLESSTLDFVKRFCLAAAVSVLALHAQTFTFEVASVKVSNSGRQGYSIHNDEGGFSTDSTPLFALLQYALGAQDYQIVGGPGWVRDLRFDIKARNDEAEVMNIQASDRKGVEAQAARIRSRLLNLLKERFQLKLREETKELPIYAITVEKGGPKLIAARDPKGNVNNNRGRIEGDGISLDRLGDSLGGILGRPVVNETALDGLYDMDLRFAPESVTEGLEADRPADAMGPSIFTALREQLGLRLVSKRGPVRTWVIEQVEKPGEN